MIIRTWACDECEIEFETHDNQEPSCPQCAAKTHWVPVAMNIGHASTKNIDNTMRDLARQTAQQFGMNEDRPVDSPPAEVNISDNQREGDIAVQQEVSAAQRRLGLGDKSVFQRMGNGGVGGYDLGSRAERAHSMNVLHNAIKKGQV